MSWSKELIKNKAEANILEVKCFRWRSNNWPGDYAETTVWLANNGSQSCAMPTDWEKGLCRYVVKLKSLRWERYAITQERTRAVWQAQSRWYKDRGRCWSDAATSQGIPREASNQQLEEARKRHSPVPLWEACPAVTLILVFLPPELWETKFLLLLLVFFKQFRLQ